MIESHQQSILDAAMRLPSSQRAAIAERLWASLDAEDQARVQRAQIAECEDRLRAVRSGELPTVGGDDVLTPLRQGRRP